VLVAVDKIRVPTEHFLESRQLHHQLRMDDFGIKPPEQARAQQFRKRREHAPVARSEVHRQRAKRGR
jgi:hypothetical protein